MTARRDLPPRHRHRTRIARSWAFERCRIRGAALLLLYVGATTAYWYPRSRRDVTAVLAGGLFLVGGTGIGFVAQQFIAAGVAAIIFSLAPIVTAVLAWPLLPDERLAGRDYIKFEEKAPCFSAGMNPTIGTPTT